MTKLFGLIYSADNVCIFLTKRSVKKSVKYHVTSLYSSNLKSSFYGSLYYRVRVVLNIVPFVEFITLRR